MQRLKGFVVELTMGNVRRAGRPRGSKETPLSTKSKEVLSIALQLREKISYRPDRLKPLSFGEIAELFSLTKTTLRQVLISLVALGDYCVIGRTSIEIVPPDSVRCAHAEIGWSNIENTAAIMASHWIMDDATEIEGCWENLNRHAEAYEASNEFEVNFLRLEEAFHQRIFVEARCPNMIPIFRGLRFNVMFSWPVLGNLQRSDILRITLRLKEIMDAMKQGATETLKELIRGYLKMMSEELAKPYYG